MPDPGDAFPSFLSQPNDTFAVSGSDVVPWSGQVSLAASYAVGEDQRFSVGAQVEGRDGYWSRGVHTKFEWLF